MSKKPAAGTASPCFILFGIPSGGKIPVAARFSSNDIEVARWIARHEGLSLLTAETPPTLQLASMLREWQLRANGSPILPPISLSLWENLRSFSADAGGNGDTVDGAATDEQAPMSDERVALCDAVWSAMAVLDVVLAPELNRRGSVEGWWEAKILAIADDVYTVCWLEEPLDGFSQRRRYQLAPLHPRR